MKSHVLLEHAADWLENHRVTFGVISEQDGESAHRIYAKVLEFYSALKQIMARKIRVENW